ncbi:SpoIIE family protein phosphatase [Kitasatospora sp. NBC_01287]|uniref:SpoIIE family protein phosphatase n=1 Tax=Kitasatospora sp. NBC_01287 TaxID=2903573 RepID=UPI00224CCE80|nr:SpoIIE family protein phosphatase [Kitasatospora sp. NBC_01287]MCX4750368.1 SpoIIE family protein phosphatase [Kitasatospora sp. NBC_01287]
MREGEPSGPSGPRPAGGSRAKHTGSAPGGVRGTGRSHEPRDPHEPRDLHEPRDPHDPRECQDSRDEVLATAARKAVLSTEAYGCVIYLRSRDRRALLLTTVAGVPVSLLDGFRRLPVGAALPASAAYRDGRTITLTGPEETMRRFPQLLVGLPYAFASVCAPIASGAESFGVLCALWPASEDGIASTARRHLRTLANRLGASLAALAERGDPVESAGGIAIVELPAPTGPVASLGLFEWNLATDVLTVDERARALLGLDAGAADPRGADLARLLHPGDLATLRAAGATAGADPRQPGRSLALRLRLRPAAHGHRHGHEHGHEHEGGHDWGARSIQLWARPLGSAPGHLAGALLDISGGEAAAGAVERLRHGVFSLDPEGWITYANRATEMMLGAGRAELLGRHPWEALPWLADPTYEDRYRAAMLSQQPTSFLACRPPEHWLAFSLYPDAHGVTGTVVPATAPPTAPGSGPGPAPGPAPAPGPGPSAPGAPAAPAGLDAPVPAGPGAMHHLMRLASLLTQAVTVREVCTAVAEQILPAFGGQQLAIYVVRDNRLHLALQSGYPDGFLDRFEGSPMRARLPGVEALSTGSPIFFESVDELAAAYPGIPLDERSAWAFLPLIASGRPVGSCILGFEDSRPFTPDERGVLTALGGLIAQALERARLYDTEFALARGLQHALLPNRLPEPPGLEIAARYLPGTSGMEIGGDWYDVIVTGQGVSLVIGDVEGHSVAAAATMGQLRSIVRAFATSRTPPEEVLARTNRLLDELDPGLLASCLLIRVDPLTGHARAARAGHLPPLLRHPDGHTEVLDLAGGPLLGVDAAAVFPAGELVLPAGSVLALYTDGLVEEAGIAIDQGIDRLRSSLAHAGTASLESLADRLVGDARRSTHRVDDVALLLTRREEEPTRGGE